MLHSTTQRVDRSDLIKHHLQGHSRPRQANVTSPWKQSPTRSRWTETRRDGTPRQTNRTEPKQRRLEKQSSPTRSGQTDGHGQVNTDRSTRTGNMQLYHNTGAVQRYEDAHFLTGFTFWDCCPTSGEMKVRIMTLRLTRRVRVHHRHHGSLLPRPTFPTITVKLGLVFFNLHLAEASGTSVSRRPDTRRWYVQMRNAWRRFQLQDQGALKVEQSSLA